jgi:hypothetical protein
MHFRDLNEPQILALAITAEEEDEHRHRLIDLYRQRFGEHIPLVRRQDVKGFFLRRPSWFTQMLRPEHARDEAALMEIESPLLRSSGSTHE